MFKKYFRKKVYIATITELLEKSEPSLKEKIIKERCFTADEYHEMRVKLSFKNYVPTLTELLDHAESGYKKKISEMKKKTKKYFKEIPSLIKHIRNKKEIDFNGYHDVKLFAEFSYEELGYELKSGRKKHHHKK
jgi:hypothetical protein